MAGRAAQAHHHSHHPIGGGWVSETPSARDLHARHPKLRKVVSAGLLAPPTKLPAKVDLRRWCGRIRFQGGLQTCNAHVVASLLEYFERRAFGKVTRASPLFLYRAAKNFARADDAAPVYIRQTMGVLRMLGVPPEKYWPYPRPRRDAGGAYATDDPRLHVEPTAFCYALAADYQAVRYYRLDQWSRSGKLVMGARQLLEQVKQHLAHGIPMTLGVPLYREATMRSWTRTPGIIGYPAARDVRVGGHAMVAVGYDDAKPAPGRGRAKTRGALLVQNSWGTKWGEKGFGWLSYEYVLEGRARDFWTLTRAEWTDTGAFEFGKKT